MGPGRRRVLSVLAFVLLAFSAELAGRALTAWIDIGRHIGAPEEAAAADYYPVLLVLVKLSIALLLARLCWRVARARAIERAALRRLGRHAMPALPRPTIRLSPRLWLAFFTVTSIIYLTQTDAEHAAAGRWTMIAPWLHTSALPVFAVLAVLLAVAWRAVQRWLADYERYAEVAAGQASLAGLRGGGPPAVRSGRVSLPPRRLFGLSFESRPPPLPA